MVDKRLATKPKPKNNESDGAVTLRVSPPQVKVGVPKVDVTVEAPQLNMDSSQFAEAINQLTAAMNQIAQQQYALLEIIREQGNAMASAAGSQPDIKVAAPVVKMPARPRSFGVEIEDEKGDTTYMRIVADSPN